MTTFPLKPIDYEIIVSITRDAGQHGTKILDHIVFELKPDREFGYIKTLDSTREVPRSTMLEISKNMRKILSLRFDPEQKVYTGRSLTFRISAGEQSIVWKNQGVETSDVVQNDVYDGILEMLLEYASKL